MEDYRPVLEAGAELGARCISVIGAPVGGPALALQGRIDLFGALCEAAGQHGLRVGVECMLYRDIRTVAEALSLIEAAGSDDTGIILDVLHLHRAGTHAAEIAALPTARVAYAQICDVAPGPAPALEALPTEARSGRLHPGQGIAALQAFLTALPEGTALAVETPVEADAGQPTGRRLQVTAEHARSFLWDWAR
jgi:sugar phosphate isomerase/epimerase